jgi:chemotaxis protein MotD
LAIAVIAVPVLPAITADTTSADGDVAAAQSIASAAPPRAEPAQDPASPAALAADLANAASPVATKVADPAQPEATASIPTTTRLDAKGSKPKGEPAPGERTATPPRSAPVAQSAGTGTPDEPAPAAVHGHAPAPDHTVATAPSEVRDVAPANAAPGQPNTGLPTINLAAAGAAMPTLAPITALRIDTAPEVAVPVAGLAIEIVSRAQEGLKRFDIRLDPPDLGRIDVRLDVDHNGRVTSRLIVERAETLDLLRRDQPSLERALQQAGLKTDGGIDFSLRDQSQSSREQAPRDNAPTARLIIPDDEAVTSETVRGYGRLIGLGGGVDIRV